MPTKKPPKTETVVAPSLSDALADEVADETSPWPEGSPELRPAITLTRRERATLMGGYADLMDRFAEVGVLPEGTSDVEDLLTQPAETTASKLTSTAAVARQAALVMNLTADAIDLMRPAAVNPEAYEEWADTVGDMDALSLMMAWAQRMQLGEASRSAT